MKILYAYQMDPRDPHVQSGRPYSTYQQMLASGHAVDVLVVPPSRLSRLTLRKVWSLVRGVRYGTERTRRNSRTVARAVQRAIASAPQPYDVIFSPSTYVFADLKTQAVKAACVDTLFEDLITSYFDRAKVDRTYIAEGNAHEQRAVDNLDLLIVPSRMARDLARDFYGVPLEKTVLAPFGGNLKAPVDDAWLTRAIEQRASAPSIDFLFVGREWERKNGDLVAATCAAINAAGVPSHAHFVGLDQPEHFPAAYQAFSTFHGRMDLRSPAGVERFLEIAGGATFFFTPSKAEAFSAAYLEATSLALPLIGSDVGGIRDIVTPESGILIDPDGTAEAIAGEIIALFGDRERYRALCRGALADSRARLNWAAFWRACEPRLLQAVAARRG